MGWLVSFRHWQEWTTPSRSAQPQHRAGPHRATPTPLHGSEVRHDAAPELWRTVMPAKSKAQQKAAGAALSAKHGDTKVGDLKGASKSMYKSMGGKKLDGFD